MSYGWIIRSIRTNQEALCDARGKSPPLTEHKYAIVVLEKNIVYKGK